jgi:hypothetical protein
MKGKAFLFLGAAAIGGGLAWQYYNKKKADGSASLFTPERVSNYPEGTLLRAPNSSPLFIIDAQGYRHLITNSTVAARMGIDRSKIQSISLTELSRIPRAEDLKGLGALNGGTILPLHYLKPMTKGEIDSFIVANFNPSKYCNRTNNDMYTFINCINRTYGDAIVEAANLYYINKIYSWDQLLADYRKASEKYALSDLKGTTFLQSLKNAASALTTIVKTASQGFLSNGPTGIFTGGAQATNQIIAQDRAARAEANAQQAAQVFTNLTTANTSFLTEVEKQRQLNTIKETITSKPVLIGAGILALVGGGLLLMND